MLAIKIVAGALIGTVLKIPCDFIEQILLSKKQHQLTKKSTVCVTMLQGVCTRGTT